ncbi:MAG TPA: dienelactone hydrolase family protein [Polyangia bacterium]|nr:dienelactone hydrolase family protein [Polyangia bacterium]
MSQAAPNVETRRTEVATRDGVCPTWVVRPSGAAVLPGAILYMDGVGMRPAILALGERLAAAGYHVLVPDLYYRSGPYAPMDAKAMFFDPAKRAELTERFMSKATVDNMMSDTASLLGELAARPDVRQPKVGVVGYCMGGRLSLCAAGHFPDRVAAAAAFHPGRVVTDAPDSPHRFVPAIQARVYVAGAIEDPSFPDTQKAALEQALRTAGVDHQVVTYPARHGFVPADTGTYDAACAERHWQALLQLFGDTL